MKRGIDYIGETVKCTDIGWFAPEEMPDDLTQVTRVNLTHYLERTE